MMKENEAGETKYVGNDLLSLVCDFRSTVELEEILDPTNAILLSKEFIE